MCGGRGGGVGGVRSTSSWSPVTPGSGSGRGRRSSGLVDRSSARVLRRGGGRGGGVGGGLLVAGESCPSVSVDGSSSNDSLNPLSFRRILLNAFRRLLPVQKHNH